MLDLNVFADRLKVARTRENMSQADLAKAVGVATGTISVYENPSGGRYPAFDKAVAIADTLGVSIDQLCGRGDKTSVKSDDATILKELLDIVEILGFYVKQSGNCQEETSLIVPISNTTVNSFFREYLKIKPILKDKSIDDYLKDGLKKALFDKFEDCAFYENFTI